MSFTKLIVVIGAAGTQCSSVISTFFSEPGWRIRDITRNLNGDASRTLSSQGVEMVATDLKDAESLIRAFEGAG
jgi:uncharacterized protein YbjT (DUF2867 family)